MFRITQKIATYAENFSSMKNTLRTLGLCLSMLTISLAASAEFYWGAKVGISTSRLRYKSDEYTIIYKGSETGLLLGPVIELTFIDEQFGLEAAALYAKRGGDDWKQQGLEIPVNLRYYFSEVGNSFRFFGSVGPNFYFNFKDDYKGIEREAGNVGFAFGGGAKIADHINLSVNYVLPLDDNFKISDGVDGRVRTWQFCLGITL